MRIYFILLISFVTSLSSLSKAQFKTPADRMAPLITISLELARRAADNFRFSNPVISGPTMNNALRLLSRGARDETRAEIDALGIHPQQEDSNESSSAPLRLRAANSARRILVASGRDVQIDNRFREIVNAEVSPVSWSSQNLEYEEMNAHRNFNRILKYFSGHGIPPFIDRNTHGLADNSFLQIISVERVTRPLVEVFKSHPEILDFVSTHVPSDMQTLESGHSQASLFSNLIDKMLPSDPELLTSASTIAPTNLIVSHLDFTEPLRHLMPTAFSPQADFNNMLSERAAIRWVHQANYFRTNRYATCLTSMTRFTFHVSPAPFFSQLNAPRRSVGRLDQNQAARESTLSMEVNSQLPPAGDVPPLLFGIHQASPHRSRICQLDLREDGSFSMILDRRLNVFGIWELVPCDNPSLYRIHFSNIQNDDASLPDHRFKDISVDFKLVDTVTVLDKELLTEKAEETGNDEIYTYYSSIAFEQNPIEMVYQQYPNAQPDDANNDKKTFYPLPGQVRGYYKLLSKDEGN